MDAEPALSIAAFLEADHRRLDALLREATQVPGAVDAAPFERFRAGLLRHIGLEEKLLFPAVRRAAGADAVPDFARLRQDHATLVSMLVPTPTAESVERLLAVLGPHNALEEREVYAACEAHVGAGGPELLEAMRRAPEVPTRPHQDRRRPSRLR